MGDKELYCLTTGASRMDTADAPNDKRMTQLDPSKLAQYPQTASTL